MWLFPMLGVVEAHKVTSKLGKEPPTDLYPGSPGGRTTLAHLSEIK